MDALLSLLKEFDIANLLPEAEQFMSQLRLFMALAVMVGPLVLLGMGAWYYFMSSSEDLAERFGLRTYGYGDDPKACRYVRRLAAMGFGAAGAGLTVVMGILCLFFGLMQIGTVVGCALICVLLQLAVTAAVRIGVQVLVKKAYAQ